MESMYFEIDRFGRNIEEQRRDIFELAVAEWCPLRSAIACPEMVNLATRINDPIDERLMVVATLPFSKRIYQLLCKWSIVDT
jgi:hypothetical protein